MTSPFNYIHLYLHCYFDKIISRPAACSMTFSCFAKVCFPGCLCGESITHNSLRLNLYGRGLILPTVSNLTETIYDNQNSHIAAFCQIICNLLHLHWQVCIKMVQETHYCLTHSVPVCMQLCNLIHTSHLSFPWMESLRRMVYSGRL